MSEPPTEVERLPPASQWEYTVIPMTEMMGTATAVGTAQRMFTLMNDMAEEGWELVVSTERSSRFIGGETVLLTFRREITTAETFQERFFVEERLRREVLALLDSVEDGG